MNEIAEKDVINIEDMIYEIEGKNVMLDSDLAKLYHVETKRVNEAVNRNKEKFPNRISWILEEVEIQNLRSQIATSSPTNNYRGRRYAPRAFTEQGVYMLATTLKSKEAIQTSIRIMDTFVKMRHYINYNKNVLPRRFLFLEDKVDENTRRIDILFDKFNSKEITKNSIFYKNDIYDAYSVLIEILNLSEEEIIIIDNYAGKQLLDILRVIHKKIIIISSNIDETLKNKYLKQYKNVSFIKNDSYHDRFIIDRKRMFHSGASFKNLGKKCFAINEIENKSEIDKLLNDIIKGFSIND